MLWAGGQVGAGGRAPAFADAMNPSEGAEAAFRFMPTKDSPARRNGAPIGRVWEAPTQTSLSLTTDHACVCKYDTRPGVPFAEMAHTFEKTGGTEHSTTVIGLVAGASYTYYVKAQDEYGNTNYDDYVIAFLVTKDTYVPFKAEVEAEDGALVPPMAAREEAKASGGKCVSSDETDRGSVTFTLTVPITDDYIVWARTLSLTPAGSDDSFFVSADNGPEDIFDTNEHLWSRVWHWSAVNGRAGGVEGSLDPRLLTLKKGENTITFRTREPDTRLDRIIVTNDRGFVPKDE